MKKVDVQSFRKSIPRVPSLCLTDSIHSLNKCSLVGTLYHMLCLMLELEGRIRDGPTFQGDYTLLGKYVTKGLKNEQNNLSFG